MTLIVAQQETLMKILPWIQFSKKNNKEQKILQKKQEEALMKMLNWRENKSVDILQPLLDGLGKFLFFPFQRLSLSFKANSFVSPSPAQPQNKQSTQIWNTGNNNFLSNNNI